MRSYIPFIIISIAVLVSVLLLGNAYKYRFTSAQTIVVTGLAEKEFVSDEIVWRGSFSATTMI